MRLKVVRFTLVTIVVFVANGIVLRRALNALIIIELLLWTILSCTATLEHSKDN